jgi:hypothetical protein
MNRRNFIYGVSGLLFGSVLIKPSELFSVNELSIFQMIINISEKEKWNKLPINDIIIKVAENFIGSPYIGGSLEADGDEKLLYRLDEFDCVTFYETSLAMARVISSGKSLISELEKELILIRYRNGKINKYPSRLHYSSEWITDNCKKKIIKDITKSIGGIQYQNKVSFMSDNPKFYKALENNPNFINDIKQNEDAINHSVRYFIPISKLKQSLLKINNGDIIFIATNKAGLDYSHTGLAYKHKDGSIRFMHASSKEKKVIMDVPLIDYVKSGKSSSGISVARAVAI